MRLHPTGVKEVKKEVIGNSVQIFLSYIFKLWLLLEVIPEIVYNRVWVWRSPYLAGSEANDQLKYILGYEGMCPFQLIPWTLQWVDSSQLTLSAV